MANLVVSIVIYATSSSDANECHVALAVRLDLQHSYLYHAVQDDSAKGQMKFERNFRHNDHTTTGRRHHLLPVKEPIAKVDFEKLDKALSSTPIPRPRPEGWNCQTWLRQALKSLEKEGLVKDAETFVSLFDQFYSLCCELLTQKSLVVLRQHHEDHP